ncbi:hypothetical protein [Helicobacter salomonis]|uniref:hypothetical protein n=1 Tax=Helicobacter salomonis TaxID=56878 RepID=UPI000CF10FC5|nr:hypothetical protein [Helicobacter salomonis]
MASVDEDGLESRYLFTAKKAYKKDYPKALRYFQKAAKRGKSVAYIGLGVMYLDGLGVVCIARS